MRSTPRSIGAVVSILILSFTIGLGLGCNKKPVEVNIPGAINSFDSWAFRIVDDSDAAIHQAKTWEQCTELAPATNVTIDGKDEKCSVSHPFPMNYKPELNSAIDALNVAKFAGKAYHDGASQDTAALTDAINKLSTAVANLLTHIGGAK